VHHLAASGSGFKEICCCQHLVMTVSQPHPHSFHYENFKSHLQFWLTFNPLNARLNPLCHLLALLGVHLILHISRIRVKNRASYI